MSDGIYEDAEYYSSGINIHVMMCLLRGSTSTSIRRIFCRGVKAHNAKECGAELIQLVSDMYRWSELHTRGLEARLLPRGCSYYMNTRRVVFALRQLPSQTQTTLPAW